MKAVGHRAAVVETGALIPLVVRSLQVDVDREEDTDGQIKATSDTEEGMEPIQGGQSGIAPACTTSSMTHSAASVTESVTGTSDLKVQVSPFVLLPAVADGLVVVIAFMIWLPRDPLTSTVTMRD